MPDKEITVSHKVEAPADSEPTKSGPVFIPAVDIYETDEALTLMADLPGVNVDQVDIDLEDDVLTITAEANESELGKRTLLAEYETGRYHRKFRIGQLIDKEKIAAKMKDGVLELILPKIGPAQPRKIEVKAG